MKIHKKVHPDRNWLWNREKISLFLFNSRRFFFNADFYERKSDKNGSKIVMGLSLIQNYINNKI